MPPIRQQPRHQAQTFEHAPDARTQPRRTSGSCAARRVLAHNRLLARIIAAADPDALALTALQGVNRRFRIEARANRHWKHTLAWPAVRYLPVPPHGQGIARRFFARMAALTPAQRQHFAGLYRGERPLLNALGPDGQMLDVPLVDGLLQPDMLIQFLRRGGIYPWTYLPPPHPDMEDPDLMLRAIGRLGPGTLYCAPVPRDRPAPYLQSTSSCALELLAPSAQAPASFSWAWQNEASASFIVRSRPEAYALAPEHVRAREPVALLALAHAPNFEHVPHSLWLRPTFASQAFAQLPSAVRAALLGQPDLRDPAPVCGGPTPGPLLVLAPRPVRAPRHDTPEYLDAWDPHADGPGAPQVATPAPASSPRPSRAERRSPAPSPPPRRAPARPAAALAARIVADPETAAEIGPALVGDVAWIQGLMRANSAVYRFLPEAAREPFDTADLAMALDPANAQWADAALRVPGAMDYMMTWHPACQAHLSAALRADRRAMAEAVDAGMPMAGADASLRADRDFVLGRVGRRGLQLRWAAEALQDEGDIVRAAVQQDGMALAYASPARQADRAICRAALAQNPAARHFAAAELVAVPNNTPAEAPHAMWPIAAPPPRASRAP